MSDLLLTLGWLAVQVTVVSGLALLLDAAVSRRCPGAGAKVLTATAALLVLLTALAFCPVPNWWAWSGEALTASVADAMADAPGGEGQMDEGPAVFRLPRVPAWVFTSRPEGPALTPGRMIASGWLLGVALLACSLALGLCSLARLRRRGRPVSAGAPLDDVTALSRRLGIRRRVPLLESDCPDLPATAGWLRPVILLPADWREWSDDDRRAVLAHELAHVRRRDFLATLLALAGRALHFYHPLARGLVSRLRLRQEMAADALAADVIGGRERYLRALARLALRAEGRRPAAGPARLLLSAHGGYLVRRIEMLRSKEGARPLSRGARWGLVGTLVVAAALTSSLRGPAAAHPSPRPADEEVAPFDLSYVCTDKTPKVRAVLAFRPGVIVRQAGLRANVQSYLEVAKELVKKTGRTWPDIDVEEIEQVVMDVQVATQGTGKPGSRSLQLGASGVMIRLKKEVDWEKIVRGLCPEAKARTEDGVQVFQVTAEAIGPLPITFHAPDRRTLVMEGRVGKDGGATLHKQAKPRPPAPGWKQVERSAFALAVDNRDGHYAKAFAADVKEQGIEEVKTALQEFQALAVGADFRDGIRGDVYIGAKDEAAANRLFAALKGAFTRAQREARSHLGEDKDLSVEERVWLRLVDDIVTAGNLTVTGSSVQGSSQVKRKLTELIPGF